MDVWMRKREKEREREIECVLVGDQKSQRLDHNLTKKRNSFGFCDILRTLVLELAKFYDANKVLCTFGQLTTFRHFLGNFWHRDRL